jgi:ubiquinone/menaquinone biosynthesis C-methylase UbiE
MTGKTHWDHVYATKSAQQVSWYQPHAALSLAMIQRSGVSTESSIIDVGGGASTLVDDLISNGYRNITVLDLSRAALDVARQRLGQDADRVRWIEGDITTKALPECEFDVWHDRAVFHFLTDPADRSAYIAQVMRSVKPGGHVIVATFGADGPTQCSGLPVVRYAPDALHATFGEAFQLIEHIDEDHHTPGGSVQHFVYCHCLKPH